MFLMNRPIMRPVEIDMFAKYVKKLAAVDKDSEEFTRLALELCGYIARNNVPMLDFIMRGRSNDKAWEYDHLSVDKFMFGEFDPMVKKYLEE